MGRDKLSDDHRARRGRAVSDSGDGGEGEGVIEGQSPISTTQGLLTLGGLTVGAILLRW